MFYVKCYNSCDYFISLHSGWLIYSGGLFPPGSSAFIAAATLLTGHVARLDLSRKSENALFKEATNHREICVGVSFMSRLSSVR